MIAELLGDDYEFKVEKIDPISHYLGCDFA